MIAAVVLSGALFTAAAGPADAGVPTPDAAPEVDAEASAADGGKADASADAGPGDARTSRAPSDATTPPPTPLGRVSGRVFAKGTRTPIGGASLTADASEAGETDREGGFTAEMPCGRRRLWVAAPGFEPLLTDVDACGPDSTGLVLRLVPAASARSLETVVRVDPHPAKIRVDAEEARNTPGTLGDPFRVIEALPGVATVAWPAPVYAVRGSNPGNTGFFLDGVRVPALFHFALGPSVIHPYFFDSLDFYAGGYPARFGRYTAGIVAAETRAPSTDRVHLAADVRLYDAGAMASTPLPGGGGVVVAARYSYTAGLVSQFSPDLTLDYRDYQVRVDRPFGRLRLTLLAFGSSDVLARPAQPVRDIALSFHRVSLRAGGPVGNGRLTGSVTFGSDHSKAPISSVYPVTVDAVSVAPRLAYLRAFGPVDFAAGFDGEIVRYSPVQAVVRPTGDWDLANRRTATLLGVYVSAAVRAGTRLTLTPELRLDRYELGGAEVTDLGPRLSGRLLVRPDVWLKAAGGRATQLPSLPLQVPGVENFGLRLFGLQSAWLGSLGIGTTRFAGLEAELTGYVQRYVLTDLRDPSPSDPDPLAEDFLVRRDALSYGVELLVRRPPRERLHGWLAYTLSNNLRSFGGGVIGPSTWDQRHIFNLVLGYRVGRYTLGGRAHLNTGRPYVASGPTGDEIRRLPLFYQLDVRVERAVLFDKFRAHVYAELVNATLSRQVYSLTAVGPGQFTENSIRIVLPSIGVRGEF